MSETSSDILDRIETIWRGANAAYRDSLLEVGRLLHEYVLACLKEGDGLSSEKRWTAGISREGVVARCAGRLGVCQKQISRLIASYMVTELLPDGKGIGSLGSVSLIRFARFIRRKGPQETKSAGRRLPSLAAYEEWEIKPEFAGKANEAFRKAVDENMSDAQVRKLIATFDKVQWKGEKGRTVLRKTKEREDALAALSTMAKVGSPRDVAELIFEAIKDSEDPMALAEHLREMVKAKPKRKRHSFSEAS